MTNDERTAKRVYDALGTATELRAMKNYAGHRLSPWLGHLMVSRQETARALLTPGELMQLPPNEEVVLLSGAPPVRAQKVRYYEDAELTRRTKVKPTKPRPSTPAQVGKGEAWTQVIGALLTVKKGDDEGARREALIVAGLDRIARGMERLERDQAVAVETLALFVRHWLQVTPAADRENGAERFEAFTRALGRRVRSGRRFPVEVLEDRTAGRHGEA